MQLSKQDIAALLAFTCKDEARAHMTCVYFEPADGSAVATDGHTLVVRKSPSRESVKPFSVSAKDLATAAKFADKNNDVVVTAEALTVAGHTIRTATVSGQFPPYREVLASAKRGGCVRFGVNPAYLARLEKVTKASSSVNFAVLLETGEDESSPIHFSASAVDGTQWSGLIMPIRV